LEPEDEAKKLGRQGKLAKATKRSFIDGMGWMG
jgi:hypothetical protein